MARDNSWRCINDSCGKVLGHVVGNEFEPAEDVGGSDLRTRGPNLVVTCPDCGTVKVWYTADPMTRALHQLLDVMASVAARRMMSEVSDNFPPHR
jgi:hypothetical protein